MKQKPSHAVFAALLAGIAPGALHAAGITFGGTSTGTSAQQIAAEASFLFVSYEFGDGSGLVESVQLVLKNTAVTTSLRSNLLTGVFGFEYLHGPNGIAPPPHRYQRQLLVPQTHRMDFFERGHGCPVRLRFPAR